MIAAETAGILSYFVEAWPNATVGDRTTDVWAEALATVDPEVGMAAAKALVKRLDFMPTVAQFLGECRNIARGLEPTTALEPGDQTPRPLGGRIAAAINAGLAAATSGRPPHDHRRGADQCPRCSTAEAYLAETMPQITEAIDEAITASRAPRNETR